LTYRELLARNRDFRRLWTGQVVSEIGDWLNNIAVLALTLELAGPARQGRAIAVYAVARHLPLFLFGPVAGVVVDRKDRRRVMIASDIARAILALGFLLAQKFSTLPLIYTVGAALFSVSAFFNAAKRATLPNLIARTDDLLAANSLSASTTAATIAVGSALGGIVATFLGRETVFVANAATFLVSAEMIRRIRQPIADRGLRNADSQASPLNSSTFDSSTFNPSAFNSPTLNSSALGLSAFNSGDSKLEPEISSLESKHSDLKSEISNLKSGITSSQSRLHSAIRNPHSAIVRAVSDFREGLRYVRSDSVLAGVFIVAAGWGLGNGAARALYSVFGARLGEQAAAGWLARPKDFGISVLFVAMGAGGVLGAPLARRFNAGGGQRLGARMGRSLFFDGCGLFLFSLMPNLWGAAAVLVAREMNYAVWWTAQQTIMMRRTANAYAGRVFATHETVTTLTMVCAIYAAGAAADRFGIRVVAAMGGAIITLSGAAWFVLRRRQGAGALASTQAS
jgi:predicted MFS family arabinose efflux permease